MMDLFTFVLEVVLVLALTLVTGVVSLDCGAAGVELLSSAWVSTNGCTRVLGHLKIDSANVNGLTTLTTVVGDLKIHANPNLLNLDGLSGLTTVGGFLQIWANGPLQHVNGLSGLTTVGGNLMIVSNSALKNVSGFSGLTTVGGYLMIASPSAKLLYLDGLSGLTTVGSYITIEDNVYLLNLDGLSGLTTVGGFISIQRNYALQHVNGLTGLATVGGYLFIANNALLQSVRLPLLREVKGYIKITPGLPKLKTVGMSALVAVAGTFDTQDALMTVGDIDLCTELENLKGITTFSFNRSLVRCSLCDDSRHQACGTAKCSSRFEPLLADYVYYCAPAMVPGTLWEADYPLLVNTSLLPRTLRPASNEDLRFCFQVNFGNFSAAFRDSALIFGPARNLAMFVCQSWDYEPASMLMTCNVTARTWALGKAMRFQLAMGGANAGHKVIGADSLEFISVVTPGSLRVLQHGGAVSDGDRTIYELPGRITFTGRNFNPSPLLMTVSLKPAGGGTPLQCIVVAELSNATSITCTAPAGLVIDVPHNVFLEQAKVLGGAETTGTDALLFLLRSPTLTNLTAPDCEKQEAAAKVADCLTEGDFTLRIWGTSLSISGDNTPLTVTVGGRPCLDVAISSTATDGLQSIACVVPAAVGLGLPVVVATGRRTSGAVAATLSYAPATLERIEGCSPSCIRSGGASITLHGNNFGLAKTPVTVLVGVVRCLNVTHMAQPHLGVTCVLPPGKGVNLPVLVTHASGISATTHTLSYASCQDGTFEPPESLLCKPCVHGTYRNWRLPAEACVPCPQGKQPTVNATDCETCPAGKYSQFGQKCFDCSPGLSSENVGASKCVPCPQGNQPTANATACEACPAGKFGPSGQDCSDCRQGFSNPGASECLACRVGSKPNPTASACVDCPAGTYSPSGQDCLDCDLGVPNAGADKCVSCPQGSGPNANATDCEACLAGKYGPSGEACFNCPAGLWSNVSAIKCVPCQPGRRPTANGTACEACPAGKFGPSGQDCSDCEAGKFAAARGAASCDYCPQQQTSLDGAAACHCAKGSYKRPSNGTTFCLPCPPGAACAEAGSTLENLPLNPGNWRSSTASATVLPCPSAAACLGGAGAALACAEGHQGVLCAICGPGYVHSSPAAPCDPCGAPSAAAGYAVLSVLGVVGVVGLLLVANRKASSGSLRLFINQVQSLSVMLLFNAPFPAFLMTLRSALSALSLGIDVISPQCAGLGVTAYSRFGLLVLVLVLSVLVPWARVLFLAYKARHAAGGLRAALTASPHVPGAMRDSFILVLLLHPGLSGKAMEFFRCRTIADAQGTPVHWLMADYALHCYDDDWWAHFALVLVVLVVVSFGTPVALVLALRGRDLEDPATKQMLGALFDGYRPEVYYYEAVNMTFKLLLWSALVFFDHGSDMQLTTAMVVNVLQLCVHIHVQPYGGEEGPTKNRLQTAGLGLTASINLGGLALQYLTLAKFAHPERAGELDANTAAVGGLLQALTTVVFALFGWKALMALERKLEKKFSKCCQRCFARTESLADLARRAGDEEPSHGVEMTVGAQDASNVVGLPEGTRADQL